MPNFRTEASSSSYTPLEIHLMQHIAAHGPIKISDYMSHALTHPQYGYYTNQMPFGKKGDFTTAPEISQIFGELVGAWLVHTWQDIGAPKRFNLVELGPGRGILMADILRTAQNVPAFLEAVHIYMVESSTPLRAEQEQRLVQAGAPPITWTAALEEIPDAPILVIANEFFDCLPVRQFVCIQHDNHTPLWRERLVGVRTTPPANRLDFVLSPTPCPCPPNLPNHPATPGCLFETCDAAHVLVRQLAQRLQQHAGAILLVDYGHTQSGFGDTLQAVRSHRYCAALDTPGEADITAHVDFSALERTAKAMDIQRFGPITQGHFLTRLGAEERLHKLCRHATDAQIVSLKSGCHRLLHPEEMGSLFKVLCLASPGVPPPPGFV